MSIDKLKTFRVKSPDTIIKGDLYAGATLTPLAHLNLLNTKVSEIIDEVNTLSLEGYKDVIDCSANPDYPAGEKDWYWRVSVAGKIGGASGIDVEVGDQIICIATSAGGDEATVGTSYMIIERNIQVGPNPTPVARNNNPIIGANPINTNIDVLDAAIGITPTGLNHISNSATVNANISTLDIKVGANLTPIVRTNNPTIAANSIHANLSALDGAIGLTPTSVNYVVAANAVNANLSTLDGQANLQAVETGGGTFAELVTAPGAGDLTIRARVIGTTGNTFGFQLVDTGGVAGTVTWDAVKKNLIVEIDDGVTTDDEVAYAVNNDYFANKLFYVTSGSTGAVAVQGAPIALTGGTNTSVFTTEDNSVLSAATFALYERAATIYNGLQIVADAVNILNQRDIHSITHEHIIKHELMAVAVYDFAIHGTSRTAIDITNVAVLPDNAIITETLFDIITDFNSTSTSTTVKFLVPTDGDLTTAATIVADGTNAGVYKEATVLPFKLTDDRKIQIYFDTNDITAGKAKIFVKYVVSE